MNDLHPPGLAAPSSVCVLVCDWIVGVPIAGTLEGLAAVARQCDSQLVHQHTTQFLRS